MVLYLKNISKWIDEQISCVDVSVEKADKAITCNVTLQADVDTKNTLCDILTGALFAKGYQTDGFSIQFPDTLYTVIVDA